MSTQMKAAQISRPGGNRELIARDIPNPSAGEVRVKIGAWGICHSDALSKKVCGPGFKRIHSAGGGRILEGSRIRKAEAIWTDDEIC